MIKFEEQDGLLFRMLEEPVPLKEKDTNVLVRFIEHGVIGEYDKLDIKGTLCLKQN